MENKQVIRTSDRGRFRRCRQLWDFESPMRQNYAYQGSIKPLDFGIAFHEALDEYYKPREEAYTHEVRWGLAISKFGEICDEQMARTLKATMGIDETSVREDFAERKELGIGMLNHYFPWAEEHDDFEVVESEISFEVEIPEMDVMYQGRIDALVKRDDGYWLLDHKTAAQFGDTGWLDLDTQISAYCWAMTKRLGIKVNGMIYSEIKKSVPKEPQVNKNGTLSQNKQQRTSLALYKKKIQELGLNESDYSEYLEYLAANDKWFRRTYVHRSDQELENVEEIIRIESREMINPDIGIYPNPSRFNCSGCAFKLPCVAKQDGSDVNWILEESGNYAKRPVDK